MTQLQAFKDTVKGYADSGTLDSGAEMLLEESSNLSEAGVSNVSEIQSKVEELMAAKSTTKVKKIATEILELLPDSPTTGTKE